MHHLTINEASLDIQFIRIKDFLNEEFHDELDVEFLSLVLMSFVQAFEKQIGAGFKDFQSFREPARSALLTGMQILLGQVGAEVLQQFLLACLKALAPLRGFPGWNALPYLQSLLIGSLPRLPFRLGHQQWHS